MAFGISAPYPFRTTRAIALILARMKKPAYAGFQRWWPGRDSNPCPEDLESFALPPCYRAMNALYAILDNNVKKIHNPHDVEGFVSQSFSSSWSPESQ